MILYTQDANRRFVITMYQSDIQDLIHNLR